MKNYQLLIQRNEVSPAGKIKVEDEIKNISSHITQNCYSVGFYNPPRRTKHFWRKSNILAFDIDDPQYLSMNELHLKLKDIKHILAPSKSHQKAKNGKEPCDRYRLLIFLSDYIWDYDLYKKYAQKFAKEFGFVPDNRSMDATHLFFPSESIAFLNETGELFDVSNFGEIEDIIQEFNEEPFEYLLSSSDINSKLQNLIDKKTTKPMREKYEKFIRMLLAQRNLVGKDPNTDEFIGQGRNILPQKTIAKFIHVDIKTLRKWIYELVDEQLLYDFDPSYKGGHKAKDYKALNELRDNIIKSYYEYAAFDDDNPLPSHIPDGEWNETLFRCAFRFGKDKSPERYMKWVRSLKTFKLKKERQTQAENAWKDMKKYYKDDYL